MFYQLLVINQEFIMKMNELSSRTKKTDRELNRAITTQISVAKTWNKVVEQIIESMQDEKGD
jgi:hypothetical protein